MINNGENRVPIYLNGEKSVYEISIGGNVHNTKTKIVLTPQVSTSGFLVVNLYHGGKTYQKMLHRLFAEAFLPNPDPTVYKIVRILDGNPDNISISNLVWAKKAYF